MLRVLPMAALLAACSPALDWRDVRPEGSGLVLTMPCRSKPQVRTVHLVGQPVQMTLQACTAAELTWGIAFADVGDPARVAPALDALHAAAAQNLGAARATTLPFALAGATPNEPHRRSAFDGKLPGGAAAQEQVAVFARGTRVYQVTVLGPRLPADAVEAFFSSLRFQS
jgi:hypothetical protein